MKVIEKINPNPRIFLNAYEFSQVYADYWPNGEVPTLEDLRQLIEINLSQAEYNLRMEEAVRGAKQMIYRELFWHWVKKQQLERIKV